MTRGRFRFGNRLVESDLPLPSLPPADSGAPDIRVRLAGTGLPYVLAQWDHHWRCPRGEVCLSCARAEEGYRLGFPGRGTFSVAFSGAEIRWLPETHLPSETIEHLLIDQVLPRVLTLRGELTLHAGAVACSRGAVAFLGESGAGKSTLCAACVREGAALVGDDGMVVLDDGSGRIAVLPTYPSLRLLPESARNVLDTAEGSRMAHDSSKRRLRLEPGGADDRLRPRPLLAAYVLETGDGIAFETLPPRERFMALARSVLHLHVDDSDAAGRLFDGLTRMAASVPVRRLRYPRRYELLPTVARALLAEHEAS